MTLFKILFGFLCFSSIVFAKGTNPANPFCKSGGACSYNCSSDDLEACKNQASEFGRVLGHPECDSVDNFSCTIVTHSPKVTPEKKSCGWDLHKPSNTKYWKCHTTPAQTVPTPNTLKCSYSLKCIAPQSSCRGNGKKGGSAVSVCTSTCPSGAAELRIKNLLVSCRLNAESSQDSEELPPPPK